MARAGLLLPTVAGALFGGQGTTFRNGDRLTKRSENYGVGTVSIPNVAEPLFSNQCVFVFQWMLMMAGLRLFSHQFLHIFYYIVNICQRVSENSFPVMVLWIGEDFHPTFVPVP